jgi:hypothetical protein
VSTFIKPDSVQFQCDKLSGPKSDYDIVIKAVKQSLGLLWIFEFGVEASHAILDKPNYVNIKACSTRGAFCLQLWIILRPHRHPHQRPELDPYGAHVAAAGRRRTILPLNIKHVGCSGRESGCKIIHVHRRLPPEHTRIILHPDAK